MTTSRYINPFTDFGFKKLFGEEMNKDILIAFLNALLPQEGTIVSITYLQNEQLPSGVVDVYCVNIRGEACFVELRKAQLINFIDRCFLLSIPPHNLLVSPNKDTLREIPIYIISLLGFSFVEIAHEQRYIEQMKQKESIDIQCYYDRLTFLFLEIPRFNKSQEELKTPLDEWMYVVKNLPLFTEYPGHLHDRIFEQLFRSVEIDSFTDIERRLYIRSLMNCWDLANIIEYAKEEGRQKRKAAEIHRYKIDVAKGLLNEGLTPEKVAQLCKLPLAEITKLLKM